MKLEMFFEKFDELADTPDGAKSMRELVLRLAFSGGLTGKRPTDDGVPDGWASRTIESISASISSGFACSRSHQVENGHVHLRTHNISTLGTLNFDLLVRINPKMVDPQKASIRAGDILFNNTNSQELVGKTSLVDRDYDYGFSNHITRIRLKDGIFPGFVVFYFTLLRNSGYFARLCTRWINQAAVNTDTLKEQTIPLPPLAEQKRIVAKVDELMALCDRLEAQQQERETRHAALARASLARFANAPTPANLQFLFHPSYAIPPADLRNSIIDAASRGALSPAVITGTLVRVALATRRSERRQAWIKLKGRSSGYGEPDRIEYDDFPMLPKHWGLEYLGLLGEDRFAAVQTGPFGSQLLKTEFVESGVPVVAVGNLTGLGFSSKRLYHITKEKAVQLSRYDVQAGDLLFARTGATLGKVCLAPNEAKDWRMTGHILRVRLDADTIDPRLVVLFLWASDFVKSQVSGGIRGMTRPGFNTGLLERILIPIPPLAEQRRIVAKVEQLLALVDALEQQLAASRAAAANLLSALVAELTTV